MDATSHGCRRFVCVCRNTGSPTHLKKRVWRPMEMSGLKTFVCFLCVHPGLKHTLCFLPAQLPAWHTSFRTARRKARFGLRRLGLSRTRSLRTSRVLFHATMSIVANGAEIARHGRAKRPNLPRPRRPRTSPATAVATASAAAVDLLGPSSVARPHRRVRT